MYWSSKYLRNGLISKPFLQEARGPRRISTLPQFRVSSVTVNGCQCRIVDPSESGPDSDMWPREKQKIHVKIPRFLWWPCTERANHSGCRMKLAFRLDKTKIAIRSTARSAVKNRGRVTRRQYRRDNFQWKVTMNSESKDESFADSHLYSPCAPPAFKKLIFHG